MRSTVDLTPSTSICSDSFRFSSGSPFGCTGQPRWTQRFETIVKLGSPFSSAFRRMYAVRRDTSPCSGSARKVVITNLPSGNFSIAPTSTSTSGWSMKAGTTAKPSTGTVTTAPIAAPMPIVPAVSRPPRV